MSDEIPRPPRSPRGRPDSGQEILNVEEAAALLGVSIKTFNKVLHSQALPARKIGREWKFSRRALIEWVGSGRSTDFYKDGAEGASSPELRGGRSRRTAGWNIEY